MGRSCTKSSPPAASHRAKSGRSAISPIPQLDREGIENSGAITPACRPWTNRDRSGSCIGALEDPAHAFVERVRLRKKAQDQIALGRKIEEEARVNQHVVFLQKDNREVLLGPGRWHANDNRPACIGPE